MKTRRYLYGTNPDPFPADCEPVWNSEAVAAAGFDPHDEEVHCFELSEDWQGHPAGSIVVTGQTTWGASFAIVEGD